jgi:hypothetical protein
VLDDKLIAVGIPASGSTCLDPASQPALHFNGEVFKEEGIHRAFEPDMKLDSFKRGES